MKFSLAEKGSWCMAACFLAVFALGCGSALAKGEAGKTLCLTVKSNVVGDAVIYSRPDALRINIGSDYSYLVAKAPSWRVYLYNAKSKFGLEMSYEDWLKHHVSWTFFGNDDWLIEQPLLKLCAIKYLGSDAVRYRFGQRLPDGRVVPKTAGSKGHFILADSTLCSPKASRIIERAFILPPQDGLPLQLYIYSQEAEHKTEGYHRMIGGDSHWFSVTKITERSCPSSYFAAPTGFTPKKKEAEILFDSGRRKDAEDVIDIL